VSQITPDTALRHWIAFNLVLGDQLRSAEKLIALFSSPSRLFHEKASLPRSIEDKIREELYNPRLLDRAEAELERVRRRGFHILTQEDERYPALLREIFDPPYVLYCAGDPDILNSHGVAIVGSRRPTPYGRNIAERLGEDLAGFGLTVFSGMARGIDAIAHGGALKSGRTVAVLGSGLENVYPREHTKLYERIAANGAVISEFPLDAPPLGFHFPIRNRVISGLSRAVLVIEAAKRSGSLISAKLALEQNREVMAVPGPVTSAMSWGTNWLIQSGAKLVTEWRDVVEELPQDVRDSLPSVARQRKSAVKLNEQEKEILDLLTPDGTKHIDEIVRASNRSISEVLTLLLGLELKDTILQLPGKLFQRKY
jgi:DNA processing protein